MEAMMNDQIFDREYQAGRAALNDSISRLIDGPGNRCACSTRSISTRPGSMIGDQAAARQGA
jgi:hypothetical protein